MHSKILIIMLFVFLGFGVGFYVTQEFAPVIKENNKSGETALSNEPEVPLTKIPNIIVDAAPVFTAVLERVWVMQYYGAPAEIFNFSYDMPLCSELPESETKQENKDGVFLWQQRCKPLEIKWIKDGENLSGTAYVRMLDFGKSEEVLEDAFKIVKTDSLGAYKIEPEKKDVIKNLIKKYLEAIGSQFDSGYAGFLKTYQTLEGYYFQESMLEGNEDTASQHEKNQEKIRQYFTHRGKKYASLIEYDSKLFVKTGNFVEFTLKLPPDFFGMENAHRKGKTP